MVYRKAPPGHTEFGGGDGLIDPERRKDRVVTPAEERMELMFTNPADPTSDPAVVELGVPIADTAWSDSSTAKGTT